MAENLSIWNALSKTDPQHTKRFQRAGGFRGTAIKPIYMIRMMTEQFGPAGKGWGMGQPAFTVVPAGDCIMVYCTVGLWWGVPSQIVYGVGGDFVLGKNKNGPFQDDEAFKKSYTDALSNAMKQLGVGGDVHMGQHDDDKYVSALNRELHEEKSGTPEAPKAGKNAWTGPLAVTKLKAELIALDKKLAATHGTDALAKLWDDHSAVILQAKADLPGWYSHADADGGFAEKFNAAMKAARDTAVTDPQTIPVINHGDNQAFAWKEWCVTMLENVHAVAVDRVDELLKLNEHQLHNLLIQNPKWHAALLQKIEAARASPLDA